MPKPKPKSSTRLTPKALSQHLIPETTANRAIIHSLRKAIFSIAPACAESIKFFALTYFHTDSFFGSIGGNICMIEIKNDTVVLSFIHGAKLKDPKKILYGKGKHKRFLKIPDLAAATSKSTIALIKEAAALRPWDDGFPQ